MDKIEFYRNIIVGLGGIPAFIAILLIPSIYKRIVKPFDVLFKGKGLTFEEGVWFFSTIMRLSQYTLCIVFPNRSKTDRYTKMIYNGYDFRGKSNRTQVTLSYIFVYGMFIAMIFALVLLVYDFLIVPAIK